MRLMIIDYVDFGNEYRSISFLLDFQGCLLWSHEFLIKEIQHVGCLLNCELKRLYAL